MALYLFTLLLLPMLMGILIYALDRVAFTRLVFLMQSIISGLFIFIVTQMNTKPFELVAGGWSKEVGIEFKLDPLSTLFCAMTLVGIWYVLLNDWHHRQKDHKFFFLVCTLESTLLSLFTAYDLFTYFVMIELMTIIASILITYKKDSTSVKAGLYYLLINSISMIFYLIGIMFLYALMGSLNLSLVIEQSPNYLHTPLFKLAVAFLITSISLKAALFPLFHWLPLAHAAAPASISALLSGLIVKTGLFLFIRLGLIFEPLQIGWIFQGIGLITALAGAGLAFLQSDIKRILAFHTISQVGLICVGLASTSVMAQTGGHLHIVNHFLFKSLLFLCAGLIITQSGERNIKSLRGVFKSTPLVSICMIIGMLAITGFPFLNGSFSKALIKSSSNSIYLTGLLEAVNILTLISFLKLSQMFFGRPRGPFTSSKNRLRGIQLMTLLVIGALPLEFWYLRANHHQVLSYFSNHLFDNTLILSLQVAISIPLFYYLLKPMLAKNTRGLQRIKAFGNANFSNSGIYITGFLVILHYFIK